MVALIASVAAGSVDSELERSFSSNLALVAEAGSEGSSSSQENSSSSWGWETAVVSRVARRRSSCSIWRNQRCMAGG